MMGAWTEVAKKVAEDMKYDYPGLTYHDYEYIFDKFEVERVKSSGPSKC
jgi:hypothetical protein